MWDSDWTEAAAEMVYWCHGFHVSTDHPFAVALSSLPSQDWTITVYSTEELVWKITNWVIEGDRLKANCKPYLDLMRESLRPDDYLIELWLETERNWLIAENDRLRADAEMWRAMSAMYKRMGDQ
jgi:hypothetical protein